MYYVLCFSYFYILYYYSIFYYYYSLVNCIIYYALNSFIYLILLYLLLPLFGQLYYKLCYDLHKKRKDVGHRLRPKN